MQDKMTLAVKPEWCNGIAISTIWDVDADMSYHPHRRKRENELTQVLVWTIGGEGVLQSWDNHSWKLERDTLLLIPDSHIASYRTYKRNWRFLWFLFDSKKPRPFPDKQILRMPPDPFMFNAVFRLMALMRQQERNCAEAASGLFGALLLMFKAAAVNEPGPEKVRDPRVDMAIGMMSRGIEKKLSIRKIAETAGICERGFRKIFQENIGTSPKKYYDNMRMQYAREILRAGICNITQVSEKLGFSTPFQFSIAFKKIFGESPSKIAAAKSGGARNNS